MSLTIALALICAGLLLFIGLCVFFQKNKTRVKILLAFLAFEAFYWQIVLFFAYFPKEPHYIDYLAKLSYATITFLPFTFYHFIVTFLRLETERKFVFSFYAIGGCLILLLTTDLFVSGHQSFEWGNFAAPGPLYPIFMISALVAMGRGLFLLTKAYRTPPKKYAVRKKTQLQYILLGLFVYFTCALDFLPIYGFKFPPVGGFSFLIAFAIIAYAIIKHQILDIDVLIRKTVVFAGLLGMVMLIIHLVGMVLNDYLGRYILLDSRVTNILGLVIFLLVYEPTKRFLITVTDRFLFQKKEEMGVVFRRLAESIITNLDLVEVAKKILSTLRRSLHLNSGAIILKDESGKGYNVIDSFNTKLKKNHFEASDLFIRYMLETKEMINLEKGTKVKFPPLILDRIDQLNAIICIPLFLHKEFMGVLTLGKKRSDEEYTQSEAEHFPTLAGQIVIALSNARQVDINKRSLADFTQQAKMAAIGTLASGINHEIKNPLNQIQTGIDMLMMNEEAGYYDDLSRKEYAQKVFEVLNVILEAVEQATEITSRLAGFVYKEKGVKIGPVNLEDQLDKAYDVLKTAFKANSVEFEKTFSANLPSIKGDATKIGEVFLNIINNARQAIDKNGKIAVIAKKEHGAVLVEIADNGPGMDQETQDKIFDPFFTTKEQGKGTGLGLHICREILKNMDANITVASETGKGTTFTLEFPIGNGKGVENDRPQKDTPY